MFPTLVEVLEEVRGQCVAALAAYDRDPITTSYVGAGNLAWDDVCGTLVVGHDRVFRTTDFPAEAAGYDVAWDGQIVVAMWVYLVRCVPTLSDQGTPPTAAQLTAAHTSILTDADIVWSVLDSLAPANGDRWERSGLSQQTVGPEGSGLMVAWRMILGLDQDEWCVPEPP